MIIFNRQLKIIIIQLKKKIKNKKNQEKISVSAFCE